MKRTLAQKVLALIKGGDESKLIRFESKLDKQLNKQIDIRKDSIESLEEKIEDAKEALNDTILSVNFDKIQSSDNVESYCKEYIQNILAKQDIIEDFEIQLENEKHAIERLSKVKQAIDSVESKDVLESK